MGIRSLVLFSATLALAAAADQYDHCSVAHIGRLSGSPAPLTQSIVPAGTGNFHTPEMVCMLGGKQAGLLAIACTKVAPSASVEVPDLNQAIVTTQSPAAVNLVVFCEAFSGQ